MANSYEDPALSYECDLTRQRDELAEALRLCITNADYRPPLLTRLRLWWVNVQLRDLDRMERLIRAEQRGIAAERARLLCQRETLRR